MTIQIPTGDMSRATKNHNPFHGFVRTDSTLNENGRNVAEFGIELLTYASHLNADLHGWWPKNELRNFGEMIALMHSELSEALESWRDSEAMLFYTADNVEGFEGQQRWEGPEYIVDSTGARILGKPCGVASEFADVIIRILDTCAALDIPIAKALTQKHAYNVTRPFRHGNKLA